MLPSSCALLYCLRLWLCLRAALAWSSFTCAAVISLRRSGFALFVIGVCCIERPEPPADCLALPAVVLRLRVSAGNAVSPAFADLPFGSRLLSLLPLGYSRSPQSCSACAISYCYRVFFTASSLPGPVGPCVCAAAHSSTLLWRLS